MKPFAARLRNMFAAPVSENEERTHLARLVNALIWSFVIAEMAAAIVLILRGEREHSLALLLAAVVGLILAWLLHNGHFSLATTGYLAVTMILVTYLVFVGNGIHDIATLTYPGLILLGSLLLGKKRFVFLVGLCLLSLAFLVYAEVNGLIASPFTGLTQYSDLLILWILILVMAVTSWQLTSDVQRSLVRARQNEHRLAEINRQLETQAEDLKRSETRWRSLVENAPDLILNIAQDGTILFTNGVGSEGMESTSGSIYDLVMPGQQDLARSTIDLVYQTGQPLSLEMGGYRPDREPGWYSTRISPIYDGDQMVSMMVIMTDLTERRKAEEEIRLLNTTLEERVALRTVELQAKNRELETLTYSVSHDLKAPLRGIDGYARLLLDDHNQQIDAEGQRFLNTIRQATQQMNQLINDLLAYSHLAQRPIQTYPIDLDALVRTVVEEHQEQIQARQIDLRLDIPALSVTAEPDGLRRALHSLLDNALKFMPQKAGGRIEIGVQEAEQSITIWVKDNGMGFDMQYHDRIFEIFQRLNRAEQFPGTGIGLALVSKVMQRIGGRVWAASTPGAGATFYLEIPK